MVRAKCYPRVPKAGAREDDTGNFSMNLISCIWLAFGGEDWGDFNNGSHIRSFAICTPFIQIHSSISYERAEYRE